MTISNYTFLIILFSGLVTLIPRILPFMFVRKLTLPDIVVKYLSFVPLCILTALFVQSLLHFKTHAFPVMNWTNLSAAIPTIITAILTKNLLWIVLVGMISLALIRLVF